MTRQQHASYLKQLDAMLTTEFGAIETHRSAIRLEYVLDTKYGPLQLNPDMFCFTRGYSADIYGRFTGNGPYHPAANHHSGKWNMHLTDDCAAQVALDHLRYRLSQVMPVAVA